MQDYRGELILDDWRKASTFNTTFQSIFSKDNGVLPPFQIHNFQFPCVVPQFEAFEVYQKLFQRPIKLSAGPDNIPPFFLKKLAVVLAEPLSTIFNFSFTTGTIPAQWKHARVIPLYKGKGSKSDFANYRPISLTVDACKTMEGFVKDIIVDFIEKNNLLCKHNMVSVKVNPQ